MTEQEFNRKICAAGGKAYIVGGWVRDFLLGRPAHDKDYVVTGLSSEAFAALFPEAPAVGRDFPVFLADIDGVPCETALARKERKTGSGYRGFSVDFAPSTTIEEDLYRRDTRINSMAIRLTDGALIDPYGGREDLTKKLLRATSGHFCEDPVRALRAARQSAQLGFEIDAGTQELMRRCREELRAEPGERILAETKKALSSPAPDRFFCVLRETGLLEAVFPELSRLVGVTQPEKYHFGKDAFQHSMDVLQRTASLTTSPIARFAALTHDIGKGLTPPQEWPHHYLHHQLGLQALDDMNSRMTLPRSWLRFARYIISQHMRLPLLQKPGAVTDAIELITKNRFEPDWIRAVIASDHGRLPEYLEHLETYQQLLQQARSRLVLPQDLHGPERAAWIRNQLVVAVADFQKSL